MARLSGGCKKVIFNVFRKCSKENLDHLFYHCVQGMITESSKGMVNKCKFNYLHEENCFFYCGSDQAVLNMMHGC